MRKKLLTIIMAIALAMTFFAFAACDNANGNNGNGTSTGTGNDSNNQSGQELPQLGPLQNIQLLGRTFNFRADANAERFRLGFMNFCENAERINQGAIRAGVISLKELLEEEFFYAYFEPLRLTDGGLLFIDFQHLVESGDLPVQTALDVSIISIGVEGVHRNSEPIVFGPVLTAYANI